MGTPSSLPTANAPGAPSPIDEAPRWATDIDGNAADNAVQVQIDTQGCIGKMLMRTEIPVGGMRRVKNTVARPFLASPLDIETSSTIYS